MAIASDDAGPDSVGDDKALIESRAKYGSRVIANGVEGNCLAKPWSPPADALRCLPPTSSRLRRAVTAGLGSWTKGYRGARDGRWNWSQNSTEMLTPENDRNK